MCAFRARLMLSLFVAISRLLERSIPGCVLGHLRLGDIRARAFLLASTFAFPVYNFPPVQSKCMMQLRVCALVLACNTHQS